jgi:hypothetical protein
MQLNNYCHRSMRYFLAVVYIVVYFVLAMSFFPVDNFNEHGTLFFLAPFPTILVCFICFRIVDLTFQSYYRRLFIALQCLHYVLSLSFLSYYLLSGSNMNLAVKALNDYPLLFIGTLSWYLVGQAGIWLLFYLTNRYSGPTV